MWRNHIEAILAIQASTWHSEYVFAFIKSHICVCHICQKPAGGARGFVLGLVRKTVRRFQLSLASRSRAASFNPAEGSFRSGRSRRRVCNGCGSGFLSCISEPAFFSLKLKNWVQQQTFSYLRNFVSNSHTSFLYSKTCFPLQWEKACKLKISNCRSKHGS